MTKDEKMKWWNSLDTNEKIAYYEEKIQKLLNILYVDGLYEWIIEYDIEYPKFRYNKGLSQDRINELEDKLQSLYFCKHETARKSR